MDSTGRLIRFAVIRGRVKLCVGAAVSRVLGFVCLVACVMAPAAWFAINALAPPRTETAPIVEARVLSDDWLANIQSEKYWQRRKKRKISNQPRIDRSQRSSLGRLNGTRDDLWSRQRRRSVTRSPGASFTYRTVCVRLCDGYYYPISPSTTRSRFRRDAAACASSCDAPTRLYYQPAAGDSSDLVDLSGRKYTKLSTAYLYRTAYNQGCQCRPDPWDARSKMRHQVYALRAEQKKHWRDRRRRRDIEKEIREIGKQLYAERRTDKRQAKSETQKVMASVSNADRDARVEQYEVVTNR